MGNKIENRCGLPKTLADEGIISANFGVSYFPIDAIEEMGFNFTELEDNGFSLDHKTCRNTEICNSIGGYEICFEELCDESTCHNDQEAVFNPENWMDYVMAAGMPLEEYLRQDQSDFSFTVVDEYGTSNPFGHGIPEVSMLAGEDNDWDEWEDFHLSDNLDKWWYHPAIDDNWLTNEPITTRTNGSFFLRKYGEGSGAAQHRDYGGPSSRKPRYKKPWRRGHYDHRILGKSAEHRTAA